MKRFDDCGKAEAEAAKLNQALYVYDRDRRGMLFDQDRQRLQRTLQDCLLGVNYIHVRDDGKDGQHVDVSGDVLKNLLAQCEPEKPARKTRKIEKPAPVLPDEWTKADDAEGEEGTTKSES